MLLNLTIALRNIFRHRTRTLITLLTIAFGCVSIIFVNGFFEQSLLYMRDSYIKELTGHLQIGKRGVFDKGQAHPFDYIIDKPKDIIAAIEATPGVRTTSSRLIFFGLLSTGDNSVSFLGQGIEPDKEMSMVIRSQADYVRVMRQKNYFNSNMGGIIVESGEPLARGDAFMAILGKGLAKSLDIKPGDNITLMANTVGGSINAFDAKAKGVFYTASKNFDDIALRVPLTSAQELLRTQGVNNIVVNLNRTEDTGTIKRHLEKVFQSHHWDLEIRSWDQLNDFYTKTKVLFDQQLFILELVMAVVVLLSIFSTMNMAVLERVSEIGTLMALGTKKSGIIKLFMYEGLILGILGGLTGAMGGYFIVVKVIAAIGIPMPPAPGMSFIWVSQPAPAPWIYIFVFCLSVVSALGSSIFPAFKASRLEIATALRSSA